MKKNCFYAVMALGIVVVYVVFLTQEANKTKIVNAWEGLSPSKQQVQTVEEDGLFAMVEKVAKTTNNYDSSVSGEVMFEQLITEDPEPKEGVVVQANIANSPRKWSFVLVNSGDENIMAIVATNDGLAVGDKVQLFQKGKTAYALPTSLKVAKK